MENPQHCHLLIKPVVFQTFPCSHAFTHLRPPDLLIKPVGFHVISCYGNAEGPPTLGFAYKTCRISNIFMFARVHKFATNGFAYKTNHILCYFMLFHVMEMLGDPQHCDLLIKPVGF